MIDFDEARKLVTELHEFAAGKLPLSPASADKRKEFLLAFICEREAAERAHDLRTVEFAQLSDAFIEEQNRMVELVKRAESAKEALTLATEAHAIVTKAAAEWRDKFEVAAQELRSAWEAANRSGFPVPSTLAALIDYMVRCDTSTRATVLFLEQEVARAKAHLCVHCGRKLSPGLCSVCDNDE